MRQNTIRTLASFSQIYTPNMINLIKRPVPKKRKSNGRINNNMLRRNGDVKSVLSEKESLASKLVVDFYYACLAGIELFPSKVMLSLRKCEHATQLCTYVSIKISISFGELAPCVYLKQTSGHSNGGPVTFVRIAAATQINQSCLPDGANVDTHLIHGSLGSP